MKGKERWEVFDANVVYLLKDLKEMGNNEAQANRQRCMYHDLGGSVVLTVRTDESNSQQPFFKSIGMTRMLVTWSDEHQQDYEVYTNGGIKMGGFVNLMEQVNIVEGR